MPVRVVGFVFLVPLLLLSAPVVTARQTYQAQIPNGDNVQRNGVAWPGVGHDARSGGGSRNPFGLDFASEGRSWTTALCQKDSDGDGFTNGQELGDPNCTWTTGAAPERTTDISHPGFADSYPGFQPTVVYTPTPPEADRTTLIPINSSGVVDGYLMDSASAQQITFQTDPSQYSIHDAKVASSLRPSLGWVVMVKLPEDKSYQPHYNLSAMGNLIAHQYIFSRPNEHNNHAFLRVYAEGAVLPDGTFNATVIWGAPVTLKGFLADVFCIDRVNGLDGANMITQPEKHTKHCMVLSVCVPGGYAVHLAAPGQSSYGPLYNLSADSNEAALRWLRTLPERQDDLYVTVTGTITRTGAFNMTSLTGPKPIIALWAIIVIALVCFVGVVVAVVLIVVKVVLGGKSKQSEAPEANITTGDPGLVVPSPETEMKSTGSDPAETDKKEGA